MNVNDGVKIINSGSHFYGYTGKIVSVSKDENVGLGLPYLVLLTDYDKSNYHVRFGASELELLITTVKAIDLNRNHLWHWTTVTDYAGKEVRGVIHRIELSGDPRTRVVLRVMTQERESGGVYWSTFGDEVYVNQDADVEIGNLLPESERYGIN